MYMLSEYSVHSCTCTLCKNSASGTSPVSLCVHMCVHSCTCTLCKDSVRNKNPKYLQAVQAQSVCVHVHVCVCVCVHVCVCVCVTNMVYGLFT